MNLASEENAMNHLFRPTLHAQSIANIKQLLLLLGLLITIDAQASDQVWIEDFAIEPGAVVTVPIRLSNNVPTRGIQFKMTLSPGLSWDKSLRKSERSDTLGMNLVCNTRGDSVMMVILYPLGPICYEAGKGEIGYVNIRASQEFTKGSIHFSNCYGSTIDNKNINFPSTTTQVIAGGTTVPPWIIDNK